MSNVYQLSNAISYVRHLAERPAGLIFSSIGTLGAGTLNFFDWISGNAGAITVLCTVGGLMITAIMNIRRDIREDRESRARMSREQIEHEERLRRIERNK